MDVHDETPTARTFRLRLSQPRAHLPGQHYVVRLTAPDGYRAQRSYSVSSPPNSSGEIELAVELLPEGEVSTFLHQGVEVGDELEVRGPIGGWFIWRGQTPALLIGGGSGIVPLMAMLRYARAIGQDRLVAMVVSARSREELLFAAELEDAGATIVYTRAAPPGTGRLPGRLVVDDLGQPDRDSTVYICGSNGFADHATQQVMQLGFPSESIRVERFGATA